jgi:hypothetical protein
MNTTTIAPGPPRLGCHFCDGSGVTNQSSSDQAVADGLGRIAWIPGTRCMCTYTWAEIAGSVAEICMEIANGTR